MRKEFEFENLLSINVERNKREQVTKQAMGREREGDKEGERDRHLANNECRLCCLSSR